MGANTLTIENSEWRNFIIPIEEGSWLSIGQWWDEDTATIYGSEVALFQSDTMVGEPVRYKYADYFQQLINQVLSGDYTPFTRQYLVELELPFENDNQSA